MSSPAAVGAVLGVLSCGAPAEQAAERVVRDSAGITIVRNQFATGHDIEVVGLPSLQIGGAHADGSVEFSGIRGAVRLANGSAVVADGASNEIRLFTKNADFVRTFGGTGEGPGQFQALSRIGRYRGDSIWAYDVALARLTVVDMDDLGFREFSLADLPLTEVQAVGPSGSFFVWRWVKPRYGPPEGLRWDSVHVFRVGAEGAERDTLAFLERRQVRVVQDSRGGPDFFTETPYHLAPTALGVARDSSLYWGDATSFSIRRYDENGALVGIFSWAADSIRVTRAIRQQWIDATIQELGRRPGPPAPPEFLSQLREQMAEESFAQFLPSYGLGVVDSEGRLWVGEVSVGADSPTRFAVFDPIGRWIGNATLPARTWVLEIGTDYLVVGARTDFDVEVVQVLELRYP